MLSRVCRYLKNYFVKTTTGNGDVTVADNKVFFNGSEIEMNEGQYFALAGLNYVYGVYAYGDELEDSTFEGAVWIMQVPKDVLDVVERMAAWEEANGGVDSEAMSPFQSESFGGYSYSKASGGSGKVGSSVFDNAEYASVLSPFKKAVLKV